MFKKVIIADDLGSINKGVLSVLDSLNVYKVYPVQYCDDAHLKIKKAEIDNSPFELLITDLSFKADHREQKYKSGEELIKILDEQCPDLNIIIYSVEDRLQKIRKLINKNNVKAYVCKGRRGLNDLTNAIKSVYLKEQFISPQIAQSLFRKDDTELTSYDLELLRQLSFGYSKEQISDLFKKNSITPSSVSSIEKRQNKLFIQFRANNATHLVSIVKDLGLI